MKFLIDDVRVHITVSLMWLCSIRKEYKLSGLNRVVLTDFRDNLTSSKTILPQPMMK